jgi:hypothetical protein
MTTAQKAVAPAMSVDDRRFAAIHLFRSQPTARAGSDAARRMIPTRRERTPEASA